LMENALKSALKVGKIEGKIEDARRYKALRVAIDIIV
jgi:hypothetical protein